MSTGYLLMCHGLTAGPASCSLGQTRKGWSQVIRAQMEESMLRRQMWERDAVHSVITSEACDAPM